MRAKRNGFIKLECDVLETAEQWKVSPGAFNLLVEIWRRHNGRNNGQIIYSVREAMRRFDCSSKTAVKWFYELQEKGFIVATKRGSFHQKTGAFAARATTWRLTMERCDGNAPTRDYLQRAQ